MSSKNKYVLGEVVRDLRIPHAIGDKIGDVTHKHVDVEVVDPEEPEEPEPELFVNNKQVLFDERLDGMRVVLYHPNDWYIEVRYVIQFGVPFLYLFITNEIRDKDDNDTTTSVASMRADNSAGAMQSVVGGMMYTVRVLNVDPLTIRFTEAPTT